MSVLNQSGEEQVECPLCMEPLEVDDLHFYPCTCGYQICRFCWNRIREGENGLCPACRKAYPENPADFTPLSQEQVAAIKTEKKAREQKRRNKTLESRRLLANVRVVQNNLVFVVGLPVRLADPEILKRQEYFGKYGKIHKVVINQSTTYAGSQGPSASAYVTYVSSADALRAIQGVNNATLDGRVLKGSLGTTKYCANFMKNLPCPKPDCMYLHDLGDPKASFTKEEMHAGLHQVYERKLHNQLLAMQRDPTSNSSSGNSSTNAEKNGSKEGNPSNFIPTTVVTSSHINVVNSTKSNKKESVNGNGNGNGNSSGRGSSGNSDGNSSGNSSSNSSGSGSSNNSVSSGSSGNGKDTWPSLSSSPPSDSPARKQSSPKPQHSTVKSQENGTSESSSPTELTQQPAPTKSKDTETKTSRKEKENSTNGGQPSKKSKTDNKKQKSNSIINSENDTEPSVDHSKYNNTTHSVFENETQQYLSTELDELESDRHSLLENHDLLDNSDHSLLDDDNTHNLLNDVNNEAIMMQRHREMLSSLDTNHMLPHAKTPVVNGFGMLDRDMGYLGNDRQISQMSQGLMDQKELLLRDRSRSEMLMRQNEMLARQHNAMVEPKHYMPTSSIGLDNASELLGANFHQNPNMLPPFGMRVDNSMATNSMSSNSMPSNSMAGFMMHNQHMMQQNQQQMQAGMVNGFDSAQSVSEGRYLAENMDKFFMDFHKTQQMRMMVARGADIGMYLPTPTPHTPTPHTTTPHTPTASPHNMLSAERLEMEHKQRMNNVRNSEVMGHRAAGDGDDDLDFDPFKETQKALAEMMETEMMQNSVSSGDNMERVRRSRLPPPGFGHMNAFAPPRPQPHPHHQDWTQMDPAIMSTSVNFGKPAPAPHMAMGSHSGHVTSPQQSANHGLTSQQQNANHGLTSQQQNANHGLTSQQQNANHALTSQQQNASHGLTSQQQNANHALTSQQQNASHGLTSQQQELFLRFNQLSVQPGGKPMLLQQWAGGWQAPYAVPLPPGFAPPKPAQHPAECIDAK